MKKVIIGIFSFFAPVFAFAQTNTQITSVTGAVGVVQWIFNTIISLAIGYGIVMFVIGMIKFLGSKDPKARGEAQDTIINAIIALIAVTAIWGIVNLIRNSFLGTQSNSVQSGTLPCVPGTTTC